MVKTSALVQEYLKVRAPVALAYAHAFFQDKKLLDTYLQPETLAIETQRCVHAVKFSLSSPADTSPTF